MEIPREGLGKKMVRRMTRRPRAWAWWCWGNNQKDRRVALGPFSTEAEGMERGLAAYPGAFKCFYVDTINLEKAKQKLKGKDLEEGRQIDEAMRHASSELP